MADMFCWYPRGDVPTMLSIAQQYKDITPPQLEAMPEGCKVMQIRWLLMYEGYIQRWNADPVTVFEQGFIPVGRMIRMLRPVAAEIKRRRITLDGIFIDSEAGFSWDNMRAGDMDRIYASPRARAALPPRLRNLRMSDFHWSQPNYKEHITNFNRYASLLVTRAIRKIVYDTGLFTVRKPNGERYTPPIARYTGVGPTFPTYDLNGWPQFNGMIDGKTSCTNFWIYPGNRYAGRVHEPGWNQFIDAVNYARSFLSRPGAKFWPLVNQPSVYHGHTWIFEQMIAHLARTGVNWANKNGWIFFNENDAAYPGQPTMLADMLDRHSEAWPVLPGLPEIPMDADVVETAGFRTTYEDYLANAPVGGLVGSP